MLMWIWRKSNYFIFGLTLQNTMAVFSIFLKLFLFCEELLLNYRSCWPPVMQCATLRWRIFFTYLIFNGKEESLSSTIDIFPCCPLNAELQETKLYILVFE